MAEFERIEVYLKEIGLRTTDYPIDVPAFRAFQVDALFPSDYDGGVESGAWDGKLLEQFIASYLVCLADFSTQEICVGVVAGNFP